MAEPISAATAGGAAEAARSYQAGNEADFERLYQASYGKILGTLTAMLGDRAAAEDCAQDAFERAYKKWSTWQPIAPAEAWVHRIAINAAVSYQRKMRLREVGEVIRRLGRPGSATITGTPTAPSRRPLGFRSGPSRRDWPSRRNGCASCSSTRTARRR